MVEHTFQWQAWAKVSSEFSLSPAAAKLRLLKKLRCTLRYEKCVGFGAL